jgi:hypothetical protein
MARSGAAGRASAVSHSVQEARPVDAGLTPLMRAVSPAGDYPWTQVLFVVALLVKALVR